ncbi:histidinol-phosphate aminotransferase [Actinoplanes sp. SE50]|uniref:pyridoxal phosphate-dependent aminotransferase n=1 Tax=unclassified Actinoplanes TaxID=2626549 RepID=UPI00023ECA04|nr:MULTISPECIES: histidinol-phosphate transaminase [unclassified Actinoplanes]AEV87083.1 histidinol-phosphate aminotransferase [Actinoplanes sp. SE50/110]ATO85481.1 histidinol-phosphate aminotransferase [Actinoplanes sp. SE50]SLM02893.1 histidinol-phosphate aminotransferase [Actinoplanes sp. SE50/110]
MSAPVRSAAAPIRLHLSENPIGPSPLARSAAHAALDDLHIYPDPARVELTSALAEHAKVDPAQVAVANGSDELVLLSTLTIGDRDRPGLVTAATFPGYRICLDTVGRGHRELALRDGRLDVAAFAAGLAGAGVGYVCNPHNPSGTALTGAEWEVLVEAAARTGTPLIVDEAYQEFAPAGTPCVRDYLDRGAPLLSLRTFSKAYALAGVRIGYAVGTAELIGRLRSAQGTMPFSVNRVGQAAAIAALTDQKHLHDVRETIADRREWFVERLRDTGRTALPSVTNFVAVAVRRDSAELERELEQRYGILVRDAGRFGLTGYLRVSLGAETELVALLTALDTLDPAC